MIALGQDAPAPAKPAPPTLTTPAGVPATPNANPGKPPVPVPQAKPKREGIEDMFSLGAFYWMPNHGQPGFRAGVLVPDPTTGYLDLTSKPYRANGIQLTFPTGGFNRLEIGYWRVNDSGDLRAPAKLAIFGANIAKNELLNTKYKISNLRVAWNYLTFPVPPFDAKMRIKSFWEVQYTNFLPTIGFPEAKNSPAPIQPKSSVIYPGFGLGIEYVASRHFRLEARASGMAWPKKSGYFDVEGNAVGRIGKLEIFGGYKGFHFHTGNHQETYVTSSIWGPMFGIRWVFR
jgi:hypothetical protein